MESKEIYNQVNKRYGSVDKSSTGKYEQTVAKAFGYTEEELAGIPEGANLGLSCGNPLALAKLREVLYSHAVYWIFVLIFAGRNLYRPWIWCWLRCLHSRKNCWPLWQGNWG